MFCWLIIFILYGFAQASPQAGAPSITAIYPNAGAPDRTISAVIKGTGFDGATSVAFSGTGVTATIDTGGTSTSLPVTIHVLANAASGPRTVTVATPNGTSQLFNSFVVTNASIPSINPLSATPPGLSQSVAPLSGSPFVLTVNGENFTSDCRVVINGTALATTFASENVLTATVPTSLLSTVGKADVAVGKVVDLSGSFRVDVVVTSPVPVYAYQLVLNYDQNLFTVYPDAITGGTRSGFTSRPVTIDTSTPGRVFLNNFTITLPPSGTFTIARVTFTPIAAGTSALTLGGVSGDTLVTDVGGNAITQASMSLSRTSLTTNPISLTSNAVGLKVVERGDINGYRSVNIGEPL